MQRLKRIMACVDAALGAGVVAWRVKDVDAYDPTKAFGEADGEKFEIYVNAAWDYVRMRLPVLRIEAAGATPLCPSGDNALVDIADDDVVDLMERAWSQAPALGA